MDSAAGVASVVRFWSILTDRSNRFLDIWRSRRAFVLDALVILTVGTAAAHWYAHVREGVTAPGFPLDDAWIHVQFGHNVASGHGFSFNPGIPSSGSTAPLWTLLLAVPLRAGIEPITSAIGLGQACLSIAALSAMALARQLTHSRAAGVLAGLGVVLAPRLVWAGLSGMEVPLYAALVTSALAVYVRALTRRDSLGALWGVLAGLAGWARPETFMIVPLLVGHWWWIGARDERGGLVRRWWLAPALCAAVIAGFVAFNLSTGGRILPNTFYAKTYGMGTVLSLAEGRQWDALKDAGRYPFRFLEEVTRWQATQLLWLFGGALPGVLLLLGLLGNPAPAGGRLIVAVLFTMPVLKALTAPEPGIMVHDGRYIAHLLVLAIVVCAAGFAGMHRMARPRWVVPALAVAALAQLGAVVDRGAKVYAAEVKNINDLQLVTAKWLVGHTTPDARIATNDIGALAFFTGRFIVDTEGLVTPEAIKPKRARKLAPFLESQRPDLLVIFPEWYPELSSRTDILTEVAQFSAERVIAGGRTLVVYRMPWSRPEALRGIASAGH